LEMTDGVTEPLILDLLEWLRRTPRSYAEAMDIWRTSCPRLTVWEDARDAGYVMRLRSPDGPAMVEVTALGRSVLEAAGRA
jgi:hypothetical protein